MIASVPDNRRAAAALAVVGAVVASMGIVVAPAPAVPASPATVAPATEAAMRETLNDAPARCDAERTALERALRRVEATAAAARDEVVEAARARHADLMRCISICAPLPPPRECSPPGAPCANEPAPPSYVDERGERRVVEARLHAGVVRMSGGGPIDASLMSGRVAMWRGEIRRCYIDALARDRRTPSGVMKYSLAYAAADPTRVASLRLQEDTIGRRNLGVCVQRLLQNFAGMPRGVTEGESRFEVRLEFTRVCPP